MPIDLDKPVELKEPTISDFLERIARATEKLLETSKRGVYGVPGTEVVPEFKAYSVPTQGQPYIHIPANRWRKRLLIRVAYQMDGLVLAEIRSSENRFTGNGFQFIDPNGIEMKYATNDVYVFPAGQDQSGWNSDVTYVHILEENGQP